MNCLNVLLVAVCCGVMVVSVQGQSCPFASTTPCTSCSSSPTTCTATILSYCIATNDTACDSIAVSCTFQSGADPCTNAVCVGTAAERNEDLCVDSIVAYCTSEQNNAVRNTSYVADSGCSGYVQTAAATTLLSTPTSFTGSTSITVSSIPDAGLFSLSTCMTATSTPTGYLFSSSSTTTSDIRCFAPYISASNSVQVYWGDNLGISRVTNTFTDASKTLVSSSTQRLTFVATASAITVYLNGNVFGSASSTTRVPVLCSENNVIGAKVYQLANKLTNVVLNDMTIYNYALTSTQVQSLATCAGAATPTPTPTATPVPTPTPAVVNLLTTTTTMTGANSVTVSQDLSYATMPQTLTACVNIPSTTTGYLFASSSSTTTDIRCLDLYVTSSTSLTLYYDLISGTRQTMVYTASSSFASSSWHRITFVSGATSATTYVDSTSLGSKTYTEAPRLCANTLIGARYPGPTGFITGGQIGAVTLYPYAMTSTQVSSLTSCGPTPTPTPNIFDLVTSAVTLTGSSVVSLSLSATSVPVSITSCVSLASTATGYLFASSSSTASDIRCLDMYISSATTVTVYYDPTGGSRQTLVFTASTSFATSTVHRLTLVASATAGITVYVDNTSLGTKAYPSGVPLLCANNMMGARYSTSTAFAGYLPSGTKITRASMYLYELTSTQVSGLGTCPSSKAEEVVDEIQFVDMKADEIKQDDVQHNTPLVNESVALAVAEDVVAATSKLVSEAVQGQVSNHSMVIAGSVVGVVMTGFVVAVAIRRRRHA